MPRRPSNCDGPQPPGRPPTALSFSTDGTARRRGPSSAWSELGVVERAGAANTDPESDLPYRFDTGTLPVGRHQFRLRPERSEGRPGPPSKVVTATIRMDEAYRLSISPNPVRSQATVELAVKESQDVQVRLYDLLGRRAATLRSGPLPGQTTERLPLDVSATGLSSGQYFLQVKGEDFAATEQITVVR